MAYRRELILANIVETLLEIKKTKSKLLDVDGDPIAFESNVHGVDRILRDIETEIDQSEVPLFMVVGGEESEAEAGTGGEVESSFTVVLWGVIYDANHSSERIESLVGDMKLAMRNDVHRGVHPAGGRQAVNTVLAGVVTLRGELQPWEAIRAEWVVTYRYRHTSP